MASSASSTSSPSNSESDSESEILHELCNNVNRGLAKASTVGAESYKSSLSAITADPSYDVRINRIKADLTSSPTLESSATTESNKNPPNKRIQIKRESALQKADSLEKVIKYIDSISSTKPEIHCQSAESVPKDKLILDSETLLILNLLAMSSNIREQYLIDVAKQRKLLITNSKTKTFSVNPDLFRVDNVPQVVDFVHQFHGKPMPPDVETHASAKQTKQKTRIREKEKNQKTLLFDNQSVCTKSLEVMAESTPKKCLNKNADGSSSSVVQKANKNTCMDSDKRLSMSFDEHVSKRQQKRLRKKLKELTLECTVQLNAEKNPRKRGRRGSSKGTVEEKKEAQPTTAMGRKNEVAAKNLIFSKTPVKIQEKVGVCMPSVEPEPSTSAHHLDELIIESIALAYKSDEDRDNCSSSVSSDSSHFPNDEETTSHFAKSDEIDSSCNEKRTASSVKSTDLIETTVLNEDVAVLTESLTMHINKTDTTRKASTTEKVGAKPNAPFLINNECRLIMTLLTAKDESTRNCLLRKAAVDRHIFLKNGDKDVLNNRLVRIKNVFSPASSKIVKFIDDNTPKRRKDKATFEGEVNTLVRRYISEADTYKYILQEMVLNNGRYDFSSEVNKVAIESFVKSLIQANLGRIVEGDIRVNEYDNTEAYMTNEDDDRDIYFSSTLIRQCAFHGTRVKAFAFTEDDRTPMKEVVKRIVRGFVVEILDDQSRKQIVGKFDLNRTNSSTIVIVPDDRRLPRFKIDKSSDVMLSSNAIVPQANTLYLVKLDYWKEKKPYASLIEEIGKADELETGNRAVLLKNSLNPTVFSESILSALPKEPFVIPATEYNSRENLTKECIFTIDPSTAKDLDDAVSCTKLESGNFEVGVHISDVSYFINENSELDNVIKDQATTIYLVNKVYHMLPRQLCDLCSLLPGQDKLTFSVFWEVTPKAEIVSTRFAKTIINSCSKFAYEHAQLMIDQPDKEFEEGNLPTIHRFTSREVCEKINMLNELATILRKKRFENGCISINQKKIIFDLNDDGEPIAFRPDDRGESNFLIEEFMLLANQSVARFIFDKFPNIAVLRNHAPPKPNMMTELVAKLETLNYKMNVSSAKTVADSIAKIIRSAGNNEALIAVLNSMIAKPMVRAEYVCSGHINNAKGLRHYALSIPIYTHFTSPIRRYPDILVHRLLAAALNIAPIPTRSPSELRQITRNCNDQKYNAKLAGEDSTNLYFLHYLRLVGPIKMRAAIKELSKGTDLHIMLIDSGHNIRVNMKNNEPEVKFIIANGVPSIQFVGCGASTAIRANIFDPVLVEVCAKNDKIKAQLVPVN